MRKLILAVVLLAIFALMPLAADLLGQNALQTLSARILIYAMAAASLNLILGYGGMVSFGHAAYFGVGAYVVGILYSHWMSEVPIFGLFPGSNQLLITLPAAMLLSGFAALVIGALSLRTGGIQFIMITLAFAQMIFFLFVSLTAYGGEDGIIIRRSNEVPGLNMRDKTTVYYVILVVAVLYFAWMWRVVNSSFGQVLKGIRQNERRMEAMGIATFRYKLYAFVLAGMGAGLAGALMANFLRFTSPDMMHWTKSGELIIMVILGGLGTFFGPILGAAAFLILEFYLADWTEHWQLGLGIILLFVVLFTKGGILGMIDRLRGGRQ
ncbi:branched-chain amino acid ABC transporter permease [Lutimaribacter sp. EGI FJ00015]|uniref:Branched-chain amino acid ABC transporter permease n=1 Tax=Lutimaribacter degradans TaxID=2945989 RepID=A0ACC5ZZG6_9RHOB|nr:branched-chain amino acid ABC transporter permease [Lutimaribacter sp. EGI FJ00013]MCM2563151.1 branched-chain amino acid ABC transporter permease [Lutimaribacter sp. EGI FJ00013]MCO0614330.1 branched-chain amino acid ABC transporter permease [Lutimaribacter sp. EGI FJ00015]MCO0637140.1 branched-chain amino acid ABC transporter permease [Lutimaribacter sp. EGI FJ00014]